MNWKLDFSPVTSDILTFDTVAKLVESQTINFEKLKMSRQVKSKRLLR